MECFAEETCDEYHVTHPGSNHRADPVSVRIASWRTSAQAFPVRCLVKTQVRFCFSLPPSSPQQLIHDSAIDAVIQHVQALAAGDKQQIEDLRRDVVAFKYQLLELKAAALRAQATIDTQAAANQELRRANKVLRAKTVQLSELNADLNAKYGALRAALGGTRGAIFLARTALLALVTPARQLLCWMDRLSEELEHDAATAAVIHEDRNPAPGH
uniref:Uncharacterized protein n=1 Tax=Mycena chlorophos TaxID=658473 RepID=A0ABQ0LN46_MYCCL|nr:predicted protein [Mycena chlorophos]